ncbi:MAG TPA: hypothetical protein VER14_00900 [Phototrophicaceae bacterium]|nr:hypothetical protein [Phototrophicaceae bacterium]
MQKNHGFESDSCIFLDRFASPLLKEFIDNSNELILSSVNSPYSEKSIRTSAGLILDYELLFCDTLYKQSINDQ